MQILLRCAKKSFNIIKLLNKNIPLFLDDSEGLVRRCEKKAIRQNGKIHKSVFYSGYNEISTDRSKYRTYQETFQYIPTDTNPNKWGLIEGIVKCIRETTGVIEVKADPKYNCPNPKDNNPAHALIICDSRREKRNEIAGSLSEVFQEVPEEKYKLQTFKFLRIINWCKKKVFYIKN